MQPTGVGGAGGNEQSRGGGGGGGGGGGSLPRFRSAPANWLEALLESELENDVVLDPPQPPLSSSSKLPQPTPSSATPLARYPSADLLDISVAAGAAAGGGGGLSGFLRQNSSPPEFLSQINSDGYFSSFGIPANYDYLMPSSLGSSTNKRPRDADSVTTPPPKKGEQGAQLQGGMGGLLDAEMEKLSEDAVLCRVRAKRGCATHPRSIAERVRRTRISDRIRKLQELVPNMDKLLAQQHPDYAVKQTNTADMLDEAVEYVKFLQRQIQELTEFQQRCKCSKKE